MARSYISSTFLLGPRLYPLTPLSAEDVGRDPLTSTPTWRVAEITGNVPISVSRGYSGERPEWLLLNEGTLASPLKATTETRRPSIRRVLKQLKRRQNYARAALILLMDAVPGLSVMTVFR